MIDTSLSRVISSGVHVFAALHMSYTTVLRRAGMCDATLLIYISCVCLTRVYTMLYILAYMHTTYAYAARTLTQVCCGVAATFGGEIGLTYTRGYPPTVNAYPAAVDIVKAAAGKVVGDKRIEKMLTMGAEGASSDLYFRHWIDPH